MSAKLAQCELLPPEARTILVTEACPPQMVKARAGRGPWARSQFDLQRLVGSGKTSNVYRVRLFHAPDTAPGVSLADPPQCLQASCIRSSTVVALKIYPKVRSPASCMHAGGPASTTS